MMARTKQTEVLEVMGLIEKAEQRFQNVEEEMLGHAERARKLRIQAADLSKGNKTHSIDFQVAELFNEAKYLEELSESMFQSERRDALHKLNHLKETATSLREALEYNRRFLDDRKRGIEEVKRQAAEMVQAAEGKIIEIDNLIKQQERELVELEGGELNK